MPSTPLPSPFAPPASSSTLVATLATPTPSAHPTPTPLTFLRSIVSADSVPHHLVFTTLALLLASGLIVRRLHGKNRYRAPSTIPKGTKKRKQDVVKSILLAQGHEEGANVAGVSASKSRSQSGSSSLLQPSAACITSTSAAVWQNLEKIGAVLKPLANRSRQSRGTMTESSTQTTPGAVPLGKVGREPSNFGKEGTGSNKKGKNKKGKGNAIGNASTGSKGAGSSDMSRSSSNQGPKQDGESGGGGESEPNKTDQGVQVARLDSQSISTGLDDVTPTSTNGFDLPPIPDGLSSSDPPTPLPRHPETSSVSVQTSPRLLPYRSHSQSPSSRSAANPLAVSSPVPTRPVAIPLAFDLHASFQATPSPAPGDEDLLSRSPSLTSTPSRSPSLSASVSSGSPTGQRPSSSSTPLLSGTGIRSRKQAKKSTPSGVNGKAIVGLPKPVDPIEGKQGDQGKDVESQNESSTTPSRSRTITRDRPAPIPIPSNSTRPHLSNSDSTPQPPQRRLSEASSSAYSTSNLSLTSSGSPYSADRIALPTMPPAMTMTPPDFARRPSGTTSYDRDETLRWSSSTSTSGRVREASLRGLGVDLDRGESEDGSYEADGRSRTTGSNRESSPQPPSQAYFQPPLGRRVSTANSFATPDSSPHPAPRTVTPFGTPSPSFPPSHQPWSPHASASTGNASLVPYPIASTSSSNPNASRPPSRQSSLSVPLNSTQQQQLHAQQQQQAYAIAHVQAQAAAQYQHVIALQYQAQLQLQQQQQQQQREDSRQRRRRGDGSSGTDDTAQHLPNGLVYPPHSSHNHSQSSQWPSAASHPVSPMTSSYPPNISHAVSPTSASFAANAMTAQTQAQMYQNYINQSAAYYLAASSSSPHSSPSHLQQHPSRPRMSSSVSAVAGLGTGGGGLNGNRNNSGSSPVLTNSVASPRTNGVEKQRSGSTNTFSPLGAGAGGGTASSNDAYTWKTRAKEAEMEADRSAKELEIARWRLSVLEGEQQANEIENQEALRALATRAMRAEARIKLLEENRKSDTQPSPPTNAYEPSPASSPAGASPSAPKEMELPPNSTIEANWRSTADGDASAAIGGPGSGLHPLSWLELDSVSFGPRPLTSSSARPPLTSSHSSSSYRKRSGRNSQGNGNGNGRRQSGNHYGRRKSGNNHPLSPSLHLSVPSMGESGTPSPVGGDEEDEEEIVFVLTASKRPARSPSRRSSYAASNGVGGGGDDETLAINGGGDGSSFIDEDDIPTIEFDSDSMTNSRVHLVNPHQLLAGTSTDSQNGSVYDGEEPIIDYVGFLPGALAKARASAPTPNEKIDEEEPVVEDPPHEVDLGALDDAMSEARDEKDHIAKETIHVESFGLASPIPVSIPRLDRLDTRQEVNPPLYHPLPVRPSQIALPPSPTLSSSPEPL